MTMKVSDRLIAAPRSSFDDAWAFFRNRSGVLRRNEVERYLRTVYELAPKANLDPAVVVAQASHETGYFTSYWWNARLNPAGLGITGWGPDNEKSKFFKDGADAARGQMSHLQLYATGKVSSPFTKADDPRYDAYMDAYGAVKKADTINDLTNRWGMDSGYATKMVRHGNTIFPNLPDSKPVVDKPTDPPPPPPATNGPIVLVPWDGTKNVTVGGLTYTAARGTVTVDVEDGLNVRAGATTSDAVLRTVPKGTVLKVLGSVEGENVAGEASWWITETYERAWAGGTKEKP